MMKTYHLVKWWNHWWNLFARERKLLQFLSMVVSLFCRICGTYFLVHSVELRTWRERVSTENCHLPFSQNLLCCSLQKVLWVSSASMLYVDEHTVFVDGRACSWFILYLYIYHFLGMRKRASSTCIIIFSILLVPSCCNCKPCDVRC